METGRIGDFLVREEFPRQGGASFGVAATTSVLKNRDSPASAQRTGIYLSTRLIIPRSPRVTDLCLPATPIDYHLLQPTRDEVLHAGHSQSSDRGARASREHKGEWSRVDEDNFTYAEPLLWPTCTPFQARVKEMPSSMANPFLHGQVRPSEAGNSSYPHDL